MTAPRVYSTNVLTLIYDTHTVTLPGTSTTYTETFINSTWSPTLILTTESQTFSSTPPTRSSTQASVSKGAIAGIAIGALLGIIVILGAFFVLRRRRKHKEWSKQTPRSDVYEKGLDRRDTKPELVGSKVDGAIQRQPYDKPELAITRKPVPEPQMESSVSDHHSSSRGLLDNGMRIEADAQIPRSIQTAVKEDADNINVLKAQERELAHRLEVNESLMKLRAEHAALQDRIRLAEMQAREVNASGRS